MLAAKKNDYFHPTDRVQLSHLGSLKIQEPNSVSEAPQTPALSSSSRIDLYI
jgi:hypothetical protein